MRRVRAGAGLRGGRWLEDQLEIELGDVEAWEKFGGGVQGAEVLVALVGRTAGRWGCGVG